MSLLPALILLSLSLAIVWKAHWFLHRKPAPVPVRANPVVQPRGRH